MKVVSLSVLLMVRFCRRRFVSRRRMGPLRFCRFPVFVVGLTNLVSNEKDWL